MIRAKHIIPFRNPTILLTAKGRAALKEREDRRRWIGRATLILLASVLAIFAALWGLVSL